MIIYGVVDHLGIFTDTSKTLTGAKQYATRHGYDTVASRNTDHYHVTVEAVRSKRGNWITPNQLTTVLDSQEYRRLYDSELVRPDPDHAELDRLLDLHLTALTAEEL